ALALQPLDLGERGRELRLELLAAPRLLLTKPRLLLTKLRLLLTKSRLFLAQPRLFVDPRERRLELERRALEQLARLGERGPGDREAQGALHDGEIEAQHAASVGAALRHDRRVGARPARREAVAQEARAAHVEDEVLGDAERRIARDVVAQVLR